ncbi:MAG TPA: non-homologous end-joining DNA ligase [Polyangia bacterium]|nr:non-homologous end-joining DNA ligase [Polyangia bacterium]
MSHVESSGAGAEVGGVRISHPDRVVFRAPRLTKADIARYYDAVSERMLPHVAGRPLTLLRCLHPVDPGVANGGCIIVKHGRTWDALPLRRVMIEETRKTDEYLVADEEADLVELAQMGIVEIHTWQSRAEDPYLHDRLVIDLDPGPAVRWPEVVATARAARDLLGERHLRSWVKTTGGKGLHVVVPLEPTGWQSCLAFAKAVAARLVEDRPKLLTVAIPKAGRESKILVDTLRNGRGNTAVAAFSLRARAGAPISTPLAWDELGPGLDPAAFTVPAVLGRARRADPWADFWDLRQRLPPALQAPR